VRERVAQAASRAGRTDDVAILLAAKTSPVEAIRAALGAGASLIGENRVQELVAKAPGLADLPHETHLIGPLQRNKARAAAAHAQCIETVADLRLAQRLSDVAARDLSVMIQVNTSGEATKSGCDPDHALDLAVATAAIPHLRVTGFMTIGLNSTDVRAVAQSYARLRAIRDAAISGGLPAARHLSMGMSGDLEIAIAQGATIVRVGSAVFGSR
jgi:pyridoxal phosphate enzyme (YggS family)